MAYYGRDFFRVSGIKPASNFDRTIIWMELLVLTRTYCCKGLWGTGPRKDEDYIFDVPAAQVFGMNIFWGRPAALVLDKKFRSGLQR